MTYAIIESGGKQYRVSPGDYLEVERLRENKGATVEWSAVLAVHRDEGLTVGQPLVPGAKVVGTVVLQDRRRSLTVYKKKRRKNYDRTRGHRQYFTRVKITEITAA